MAGNREATGRNWDVEAKRFSFTEAKIEALPRVKKRTKYYDAKVEGLGVKCEASGAQTYFWFRSVVDVHGRGKPIWKSLGETGSTSVETARAAAGKLNGQRDDWKAGRVTENPFTVERMPQGGAQLTLAQLLNLYVTKHLRENSRNPIRAEKEERWRAQRYASDLLEKPLSRITREDVEQLHRNVRARISATMSSDTGVTTANRCVEQIRTLISFAKTCGLYTGENPASGIVKKKRGGDKRFAERSRDRFVQPEEMPRLEAALGELPESSNIRDFVVLSFETAARRSNVCAMRYDQINWALRSWYIPTTKNGKAQTVPLTDKALAVLRRRVHERREPENPWVFPSRSTAGHLMDPKRAFSKLRKAAQLPDICVHDLRRTRASYAALAGESLVTIGALLGHAPGSSATSVYARLHDSALRDAQANADRKMREMMEKARHELPPPKVSVSS
jgi:integrase